MKIAIIGTRGIPNNYGGFEQFAEYLSVGLVNQGHEVFVYNSHNHSYKEDNWKGVNIVHCFDPEYLMGSPGQFIYDLNCIINSRKQDFDIVLQLGYTSSSIWNIFMPKKAILVTNMDGMEWKRSKFSKIAKLYLHIAERLCIRYTDHFIADSLGIKDYLNHTFSIESTYIPYGAELISKSNTDILKRYNLKKYNYDIVIARIEPENNIEMIIEGYLDSKKERDLVIIGNMNTKFGKYISKKYNDTGIKYLGFVSGIDNLNSLRYFSNLYFHGHSVGGTNPSLLEAMASDALICAHENIFNQSILENDGYYFTDSKQISDLINDNTKDLDSQIIRNNHEKIRELYSWNKIIDKYNSVFHRIINN
jgi:glycosyltransferase involved in cell wall biosynthesis